MDSGVSKPRQAGAPSETERQITDIILFHFGDIEEGCPKVRAELVAHQIVNVLPAKPATREIPAPSE